MKPERDDEVLDAVLDEEEAVGVHAGDVARAQVLADHLLGRLLRALVVAEHDLRALDADLALLALGHLFGGIGEIAQREVVPGSGRPIEPGFDGTLERIDGGDRGRLRKAVALDDLAAGDRLELLLDLDGERARRPRGRTSARRGRSS